MAMLDYLIPAVAYLFSGIAMEGWVPEVSRWVWTALAVVVTTLLNLWGVRTAARVGFLVLAMEIVVLLVFVVSAVVVLARDGAERGWLSPLSGDGTQGAFALSIAVLSYLGFDAIASFAERSRGLGEGGAGGAVLPGARERPLRGADLPGGAAGTDVLGPAGRGAGQAGPAFYGAVEGSVGTWLHDLVAVSEAIGAAFAALAGQAAARLLFAMARGGRLPKVLSRTDSGVPRVAVLCAAVITLAAAVWAARRGDGMDHLVSVVDIGALTAFTLLHASVVGWFAVRRRGGPVS